MYILPYCILKPHIRFTSGKHTVVWCFLTEGGTALWKTDEDTLSQEVVLQEYLTPNGFVGQARGIQNSVLLFEVDPKKTSFQDFYVWTEYLAKGQEPPADGDVWRPFHWLESTESDSTRTVLEEDEWKWADQASQMRLKGWAQGTLDTLWKVLRDAATVK